MARAELTPQELTFQSFRHSQGSIGLQLWIFKYFRDQHNVKADLHPTSSDLLRYVSYIANSKGQQHVAISRPDRDDRSTKEVISSFRYIRHIQQRPGWRRAMDIPLSTALVKTASFLLEREMYILNPFGWRIQEGAADRFGRKERLSQRVLSGRASFLKYYGYEEHSTGFEKFDGFYRDLRETVETNESDELQRLKSLHEDAVTLTELEFAEEST